MTAPTETLPLLLLKAREASLTYVRPVLQDYGLTEPQWRVLNVLYHNANLSAQALAEKSCILSPSLSRILSRFLGDGLILRTVSSADQRSITIKLSAKGKRLCQRLYPLLAEQYRALEADTGPERIEHLTEILREFIAEPVD
jgi:homoprotocatechuate degradation regulator HpaR